MDDADTAVCCDIGVIQHLEAEVLEFIVQVVKKRLVLPTQHILALQLLHNLELCLLGVLVQCAEESLEEDVVLAGSFVKNLDVLEIGMRAQAGV